MDRLHRRPNRRWFQYPGDVSRLERNAGRDIQSIAHSPAHGRSATSGRGAASPLDLVEARENEPTSPPALDEPGITGLWQIGARRNPSSDRWVEKDLDISTVVVLARPQIIARPFRRCWRGRPLIRRPRREWQPSQQPTAPPGGTHWKPATLPTTRCTARSASSWFTHPRSKCRNMM